MTGSSQGCVVGFALSTRMRSRRLLGMAKINWTDAATVLKPIRPILGDEPGSGAESAQYPESSRKHDR